MQSLQSQVALAQNRLSYTRLFADVAGVVTARGPEPGEVVGAGRMVVQVAREGARDAVFDVPAQIKDAAPLDPKIVVSPGKTGPAAGAARYDLSVALDASTVQVASGLKPGDVVVTAGAQALRPGQKVRALEART